MISAESCSVWCLIKQSDFLSSAILFVLLLASVLCWTITIYKALLLRVKTKHINRAYFLIKNSHSLEDVLHASSKVGDSLPGYFFVKALNAYKNVVNYKTSSEKLALTDRRWEFLQDKIDNIIANIIYKEERFIPFLATTAAISPLLGLLGTVWGLIHSFMDISQKQTADISTVAPGIAEALITTLAGLLVAIPATVMYYYLRGQIHKLETRIYGMAEYFMNVIQQTEDKCVEEDK